MVRKMPEGYVRFMMDVPSEIREAFKLFAAKKGQAPNKVFAAWVEENCKAEIKEVRKRPKAKVQVE